MADHFGFYAHLPAVLLPWFAANARQLPWRADREPYHVWLSEIMLQQTRVEAVRAYYTRFLAVLPDITSLAGADEATLQKLWEGLGYYTRMRNLQKAARVVMEQYGGVFPSDYNAVLSLPGIGAYTAGAICSICFDQPEPAVDGNVLRVIARLGALSEPVDTPAVKNAVTQALRDVYPAGHCGDFTQALMELGAIVCLPNGAPRCEICPAAALCAARAAGTQATFPRKRPKKPRRAEELTVFVLHSGDRIAVRRRPEKGLLTGLYELPNLPGHLPVDDALHQAERWGVRPDGPLRQVEKAHIFTHVEWNMRAYDIVCGAQPDCFDWLRPEDVALPTAFRIFLED